MNINSQQYLRKEPGLIPLESLAETLRLSAEVLARNPELAPTGLPFLVPMLDQERYPGAYEVYYPVRNDTDDYPLWVYVTDEGVAVFDENPFGVYLPPVEQVHG